MSKKKKHGEHVNNERWLVSYADFITLLFAFFVVMFATAPKDNSKSRKISSAAQDAFQGMGMFDKGGSRNVLASKMTAMNTGLSIEDSGVHEVDEQMKTVPKTGEIAKMQNVSASEEPFKQLTGVRDQIDREFYKDLVKQNASVTLESRGIVISFKEAVLFDEGMYQINDKSRAMIANVMKMIEGRNNYIQVEGHSDGTAKDQAGFSSALDLSSKRAASVAEFLTSEYKVPAEMVSTAGYGAHRPIADNGTAEGREKNRRVDLVLLNTVPAENNMALPEFKNEKKNETVATDGILQ